MEWKVAQLLHDGVLAPHHKGLAFLAHEAYVPDEQQGLVQELLRILVLVVVLVGVNQQVVQQIVQLIDQDMILQYAVLDELHIHPDRVVQDLHTHDGETQERLWHDLGRVLL